MTNLRQLLLGLMISLTSVGLIFGSFSLSLTEGNLTANASPTPTQTQTVSPVVSLLTPMLASLTPTPSLTPTWTFTWTPSPSLTPTLCPYPTGWVPYIVKYGDTLVKIAARYRINSSVLQQYNCLLTANLIPGSLIYVPPVPTQVIIQCGPPSGWVIYYVRAGDTLSRLSQAYRVSVSELQQANCLGTSTYIYTGQRLYVPPWRPIYPPSPTPVYPTPTMTNSPVITPTETLTEVPTGTAIPPTETPIPPTETPIPPTETPAPPPSDTPPTATGVPPAPPETPTS